MMTNWYATLQNHEEHTARMQREAEQHRLAQTARANHQPTRRLNVALSHLHKRLPALKLHLRRQATLSKRTKGATA